MVFGARVIWAILFQLGKLGLVLDLVKMLLAASPRMEREEILWLQQLRFDEGRDLCDSQMLVRGDNVSVEVEVRCATTLVFHGTPDGFDGTEDAPQRSHIASEFVLAWLYFRLVRVAVRASWAHAHAEQSTKYHSDIDSESVDDS